MKKIYNRNKELEEYYDKTMKPQSRESQSEQNLVGVSPRLQNTNEDVSAGVGQPTQPMSADTVPQMDSMDASMIKLDDSIFIDFRKREEKLEEEILKKDELIRQL